MKKQLPKVWVLWEEPGDYDHRPELIGIFSSESKAKKAKVKAEAEAREQMRIKKRDYGPSYEVFDWKVNNAQN